jgi:hypothetical protein
MNPIWTYVSAHPISFLIGFGYNAICMFNAMAPPGTEGGGFYGWLYRYGHLLVSSPVAAGIEARVASMPSSVIAGRVTSVASSTTVVEETKK